MLSSASPLENYRIKSPITQFSSSEYLLVYTQKYKENIRNETFRIFAMCHHGYRPNDVDDDDEFESESGPGRPNEYDAPTSPGRGRLKGNFHHF